MRDSLEVVQRRLDLSGVAASAKRRGANEIVVAIRDQTAGAIDTVRRSIDTVGRFELRMLAEAGYLKDTRSMILQNVFVDEPLAAVLSERGETYVLRCMKVTE